MIFYKKHIIIYLFCVYYYLKCLLYEIMLSWTILNKHRIKKKISIFNLAEKYYVEHECNVKVIILFK